MIRRCDVGKVLFYAQYNVKELPGFRFTVGKMTITEVSFDGRFRTEEYDLWIPNDFIDVDRMSWRSWECENYCRMKNAQQFKRAVREYAQHVRAS